MIISLIVMISSACATGYMLTSVYWGGRKGPRRLGQRDPRPRRAPCPGRHPGQLRTPRKPSEGHVTGAEARAVANERAPEESASRPPPARILDGKAAGGVELVSVLDRKLGFVRALRSSLTRKFSVLILWP